MEIKARFDHFNINVLDLQRSIAFYEKALDLKEHHRKEASDGSFILVYLADDQENFLLELTWLRDRQEAYELGDNESHLCFRVAGDYDAVRAYHKEMGCVWRWDVYASRMKPWGFTSSTTQMTIGLKFSR